MRPVFHAKSDRFVAKAGELEKNGVAKLGALKARDLPGYDLLRQEGLLRIGRKSGTVVQRDASSGPPRPDWAQDWATEAKPVSYVANLLNMGRATLYRALVA